MSKILSGFHTACVLSGIILTPAFVFGQNYTQTTLTSDGSVSAPNVDPHLVNPWGMSRGSNDAWWISDNATGLSTLYDGTGLTQSLVVAIPNGSGSGTGSPSGTIYNGGTGFAVTPGNPAAFLFCTEDGTVSGWNPAANFASAIVKINHPGAVYKGMTSAVWNNAQYLYVVNFNSGRIEVYDTNFAPVTLAMGAFESPAATRLGFVPYNIQNVGGNLFVAFAKQDAAKHDSVSGSGLGFVAVFGPQGRMLREFQYGPFLNAPWALALAPSDFGSFSHDLLVGNFGSGQILAFNAETGVYQGTLADANNSPITIDGLWGISFGGSASSGPFNTLYYTAGPQGETHGVFGSLTPVTADLTQGNDL
jgi:uncharacterized protein (TIGR03118 family)